MQDTPPVHPGAFTPPMSPHRGVLVLVFGIVGLTVCGPLGVVAWIMGAGDLRRMREGSMDPEGKGMTTAGMVCGIVSSILLIVSLLLGFLWILFIVGMGVSGGP